MVINMIFFFLKQQYLDKMLISVYDFSFIRKLKKKWLFLKLLIFRLETRFKKKKKTFVYPLHMSSEKDHDSKRFDSIVTLIKQRILKK